MTGRTVPTVENHASVDDVLMNAPATPCLSVVIPCYNEERTVLDVVKEVLGSPYTNEVVIVDDGSTDATRELLGGLSRGFAEARGPFVIVQDADLEYDPQEFGTLVAPLLADKADVVYGSRFLGGRPHRVLYFWHRVGNLLLTTASNVFTNLNLTDMETCYKVFRREVLDSFTLEEDRFGIEPEVTAKVAAGGWRVYEVGISYSGRTYDEGKKIGWRDAVRAFYVILRYSPPGTRLTALLSRR
jgi:glycosyltransferase involved in cell wall biosynthesis